MRTNKGCSIMKNYLCTGHITLPRPPYCEATNVPLPPFGPFRLLPYFFHVKLKCVLLNCDIMPSGDSRAKRITSSEYSLFIDLQAYHNGISRVANPNLSERNRFKVAKNVTP
jgi:hypothetical protein